MIVHTCRIPSPVQAGSSTGGQTPGSGPSSGGDVNLVHSKEVTSSFASPPIKAAQQHQQQDVVSSVAMMSPGSSSTTSSSGGTKLPIIFCPITSLQTYCKAQNVRPLDDPEKLGCEPCVENNWWMDGFQGALVCVLRYGIIEKYILCVYTWLV